MARAYLAWFYMDDAGEHTVYSHVTSVLNAAVSDGSFTSEIQAAANGGSRRLSGMAGAEAIGIEVSTFSPTPAPSEAPTVEPTLFPSYAPTSQPTPMPTSIPSPVPVPRPTQRPTSAPVPAPTESPSPAPSTLPNPAPTNPPTSPVPTISPTRSSHVLAMLQTDIGVVILIVIGCVASAVTYYAGRRGARDRKHRSLARIAATYAPEDAADPSPGSGGDGTPRSERAGARRNGSPGWHDVNAVDANILAQELEARLARLEAELSETAADTTPVTSGRERQVSAPSGRRAPTGSEDASIQEREPEHSARRRLETAINTALHHNECEGRLSAAEMRVVHLEQTLLAKKRARAERELQFPQLRGDESAGSAPSSPRAWPPMASDAAGAVTTAPASATAPTASDSPDAPPATAALSVSTAEALEGAQAAPAPNSSGSTPRRAALSSVRTTLPRQIPPLRAAGSTSK